MALEFSGSATARSHAGGSPAVPRGVSVTHPITVARAKGATIWDQTGRDYVDFVGGIGVLNVGHAHPKVVAAIREQAERFTHVCYQVAPYELYDRLAERLAALTAGDQPKKTLLLSTGAEAVENAVKIARAATGRPAIISFRLGFHGRTLLALTLTGKVKPYKQSFGPYAAEVYHAPYPDTYHGWSTQQALEGLEQLFESTVAPERVAAIMIEPVLGEGGFVPAPAEYLQALRAIADRHGALLIADEVQSGYGRTGRMFAIEHSGVVPDLVTVAKSMAGGLPLAAVIGRASVMDAPAPGGLGGTFAGNPIACAAALAVLDVFEQERVLERAQVLGDRLFAELRGLQGSYEAIGDVRGLGAMVAFEVVADRASRQPDSALAKRLIAVAREQGLLLLGAGAEGNVIRILVPLLAEEHELRTGFERLRRACALVLH